MCLSSHLISRFINFHNVTFCILIATIKTRAPQMLHLIIFIFPQSSYRYFLYTGTVAKSNWGEKSFWISFDLMRKLHKKTTQITFDIVSKFNSLFSKEQVKERHLIGYARRRFTSLTCFK